MGSKVPPMIPSRMRTLRVVWKPAALVKSPSQCARRHAVSAVARREGDSAMPPYGVRGIRTLEWLLTITRFPVVLLRPTRTSLHTGVLLYHDRPPLSIDGERPKTCLCGAGISRGVQEVVSDLR